MAQVRGNMRNKNGGTARSPRSGVIAEGGRHEEPRRADADVE